jgi:hypothetical protein
VRGVDGLFDHPIVKAEVTEVSANRDSRRHDYRRESVEKAHALIVPQRGVLLAHPPFDGAMSGVSVCIARSNRRPSILAFIGQQIVDELADEEIAKGPA